MNTLEIYASVKIIDIVRAEDAYDGWKVNLRAPCIGDVGCIVDILKAEGLPDHYVVECCDHDGTSIWLSEFQSNEIELVT